MLANHPNVLGSVGGGGSSSSTGTLTGLNGQTIVGDINGAWTVTSNGTNQNVTLTPSGTGTVQINGSLEVSTGKSVRLFSGGAFTTYRGGMLLNGDPAVGVGSVTGGVGIFFGRSNGANFYGADASGNAAADTVEVGATDVRFKQLFLAQTITAAGTTGAQTINKVTGRVNFAAAASSLVVTNSLVTASSVVIATVMTNDTTLKSVQAVAASGSFTLFANAAATAETKVAFLVLN